MPLLFSLGQHAALQVIDSGLYDNEFLFAFLDDIYTVTTADRVGEVYKSLSKHLWDFSRIRINGKKTQVWNAIDDRRDFFDTLERIARAQDPDARVWRGSELPLVQQGIKVLGTPLGHSAFVEAHLNKKAEEQALLPERIPAVLDLHSSWALLLHCAAARANYLLRVVKPEATTSYAQRHNVGLCEILHVDPDSSAELRETASMPLCLGGMGLRDACRVATSAYWASWADSMPMIFQRHPDVATAFVQELEGAPEGALGALARATTSLTGVCGFEPPTWQALIEGPRPSPTEPEALEPGGDRGWQHEVSSKVEHEHREEVFGRMRPRERAQVRSQAGPGAGLALSATPTHFLTRIPSHLFLVVMLRRLRLPLPPSLHTCRCGRRIDKFGHHRASCARAGVLGRRRGRFGKRDSPSVPRSRRESHPKCHGA